LSSGGVHELDQDQAFCFACRFVVGFFAVRPVDVGRNEINYEASRVRSGGLRKLVEEVRLQAV
jgi:hypothetical protein